MRACCRVRRHERPAGVRNHEEAARFDVSTNDRVNMLQGAADMDEALAGNIIKKQRFRADDLNADDEYDFDRGIDMYEKKRGDQVR